ncbi:NfeD family protein [Streptomyces sp. NRRL F-5650]|jgi:membrane protein implicated in regulation of membrane protease activity|uniref:NfeD family protein n=1 Tax=Streptomyces sp. NRRL F-5650 TaxID=1463868 RepID=UPI0004C96253|nr:NfeD family protein [Streptomyces sp. NRRL F-5650]
MDPWLIWLIVSGVMIVAEIFTLTAALGMLGVAALITSASAAAGLSAPFQFLVFTVVSAVTLLFLRPVAVRHLHQPQTERFGVEALVGQAAYVVSDVTGRDGRVRIGGEEWSARAYDETLVIPRGATVDVLEISGTTAFVYPRE